MENKLKKLFDYQKFEGNDRLAKMIAEAESSNELSDEELGNVNAAGLIRIIDDLDKDPTKKN